MTGATAHRPVVKLQEWETVRRPLPALTDRDRVLAEALAGGDGRLVVEELRDGVRIRTTSWIGVVRFEAFEVQVVPKYAGENLGVLRMLTHARGLDALRRAPAVRDLATGGAHLLDLVALLLAEAADRLARDGLLQDYVAREEALPLVRGRLRPLEQVTRHPGRVDVLECAFDEFETDVDENRLVAAGLVVAGRFALHETVRRRVNRVRSVFEDACNPALLEPTWVDGPIDYHRRNQHYRDAHYLARLILQRLAVRDLFAPGDARSFVFLLDMNRLFEEFVTMLARRAFEPSGVVVRAQRRDRSLLEDVETGRSYGSVVPDLLAEWWDGSGRRHRLPIDAKYKLYEGRKLDPSDLYQLFFYAYAYGAADIGDGSDRRAFILFPSSGPARSDVRVQSADGIATARITALGIDLVRVLDAMEHGEVPVIPALSEIAEATGAVEESA
jgi:5-methylcytosine-specific restriction enzyme subunit McrC